MDTIFGREIAVAMSLAHINRMAWYDLTAGDGVIADGPDWCRNCSPGLMAFHALHVNRALRPKPIDVYLYENRPSTFDELTRSLDRHLPGLGYRRDGDDWVCGAVRIHVVAGSGEDACLDAVDRATAVLVSNDPNAITTWAMRPTFAMEMRERTSHFQTINTMGCNVGGLKRLDRETRDSWFDLIAHHHDRIPRNHDLVLVRIDDDDSQWAYLLCCPRKWQKQTERNIRKAFDSVGATVDHAWMKDDPERFAEAQRILFLTRAERKTE
jgi:hypothetical protein